MTTETVQFIPRIALGGLTPAQRLVARICLMAQPGTRKAGRFKSLSDRDGDACFYCGQRLTQAGATIEHLVPRAYDGPGNLKNLVLACEPCNKEARDLSVAEKVRLRDCKRAQRSKRVDLFAGSRAGNGGRLLAKI